jgi:hypothetical protein
MNRFSHLIRRSKNKSQDLSYLDGSLNAKLDKSMKIGEPMYNPDTSLHNNAFVSLISTPFNPMRFPSSEQEQLYPLEPVSFSGKYRITKSKAKRSSRSKAKRSSRSKAKRSSRSKAKRSSRSKAKSRKSKKSKYTIYVNPLHCL